MTDLCYTVNYKKSLAKGFFGLYINTRFPHRRQGKRVFI